MYKHKSGITVRKCIKSDLSDMLNARDDSWHGTHTYKFMNMEDQHKWYETLSSNTLCLVFTSLINTLNIAIGCSIISDIDWVGKAAKISGVVYPKYRDDEHIRGCCAAGVDFAFEMLNLHRLDAEVLETNYVAQKYEIEYLEFKVEGRRKQAVYKAGKYYDSLVLGLLRDEWKTQQRVIGYGGSCNLTFDHDSATKLIDRSNNQILKEIE